MLVVERRHGTVEDAERIDSFDLSFGEMDEISCSGFLLDVEKHWIGNEDRAVISYRGHLLDDRLRITMLDSNPPQQLWICPKCNRRMRFAFWTKSGFRCRKCAGLNYRRQQETRDEIKVWEDAMAFAREKLRWNPSAEDFCPMDLPHTIPPRPPRMHRSTYNKHLARWRRYQREYSIAFQSAVEKILSSDIKR